MILAGGQGTAFGVASLVVTVGIVVYNGTKLQEVLGKTWAEIKKVHEKEYAAVYAPLYFLTLTDMELLCLFPWKRDHSHGTDGFPHPDALKAAHGSGFVEDCLQIFCWVLHCAVTQALCRHAGRDFFGRYVFCDVDICQPPEDGYSGPAKEFFFQRWWWQRGSCFKVRVKRGSARPYRGKPSLLPKKS